ncbi:hypothetical protein PPERSA_01498 [Pseudocohnilembus persalinus]|uniref:Uncharacterized protein n=1 Tax=Pseudocohnilembus persalinus TaxID=266149 RepID=A0A0V0QHE9_PSEPJ|nr:hypothetical protein PPERSA_01498 [Pseudocohnilembus persalinus]|eukprot:KRX01595.1 hypothetical protein PPERSA_01498 [Pseudocohnilembus persalinus]
MNFPNIPKSTKSSVSQSQTNFYYNNQDNSPVIRPSTQEYYNTKLWKQAKPQLLQLQQLDQECDEQDKIVNNFNKTFENKQSYKSYLEQNFPFMENQEYYGTNNQEKLQRKDFQKQINYSRSYQFIKNKGISQEQYKMKELDFEEIERRVQERKKKRMIKKNELTVEQLYDIRVKMLQELKNEENNVKKKFEVMNSIFEKELNIGKRKIYMQKMQEQKEKQRLEMLSRQQVFNSFTNLLALNNSQKNRILLKQQNRRKFEEMLERQRQKNRRIKSQQQQESAEQEQNYLANSYLSGFSDNYVQQNEIQMAQNNQSIFGKQNNSQLINNGREYQLNRFLSQQNSQNLEQIVESEIDENDSDYVEGGSEIEGEDSQTDKIFSRFNNIISPNYKNIQSKVKTGKGQIKIKNKNYSLQNSLSNSQQLKINKYSNDLGNSNKLQGIDKQIQIYKSKFKNAKF